MAEYANIIVDIFNEKLDKTFQYRIPEAMKEKLTLGMQVYVPFGKRNIKGYVVELTDEPEFEVAKIKEIIGIVTDSVPIESQLIALAGWMKKNYGATMNHALKTAHSFTGVYFNALLLPTALSGCETTSTTSCPAFIISSNVPTAKSGVPINITLMILSSLPVSFLLLPSAPIPLPHR